MSLGRKIRLIRRQSSQTQRQLCQRAGLAVPHLSRIENGRIVPSTRTLNRIANALATPITSFFDAQPPLEGSDRCPVSLSGRCILDHVFVGPGRRPKIHIESYTTEQLEILRLCNFLLHSGDQEAVAALSTIVESLAERAASKEPRRFGYDTKSLE